MASWKNLAELFLKQGKSEQYGLVLKELERLNSLPAEIRSVASFYTRGNYSKRRDCVENISNATQNTSKLCAYWR